MTIQFFLQLNSVLGLFFALLTAELVISKSQRQSSTVAVPVKVREDR
jgi:hypothetical protein